MPSRACCTDPSVLHLAPLQQQPQPSVLLRGANDYMLDEMDRSLHDAFCIVKRVLENELVVAGEWLGCLKGTRCWLAAWLAWILPAWRLPSVTACASAPTSVAACHQIRLAHFNPSACYP